jgi:cytochrome c oxidase subunit 2
LPARRRRCLVALLLALPAALVLAAPAQAISLGPESPHSPNAEAIESSYWVMLALAAALIVAFHLALIGAVLRFRAARGRRPARLAAGRGALRPLVGGLTVLALAVFVFGVMMTAQVREVEPSGAGGLQANQTAQVGIKTVASETPPLEIAAIAQQWLWRFEYPGHAPGRSLFSYGELVVPVDTTVILNVDSTDVMHIWWVPALGGQVQATPGEVTQTWFKADAVGRYPGRSTVFSGTAFPAMRAWVRVVEVPEYEAYIERLRSDLTEAQGAVASDSSLEQ